MPVLFQTLDISEFVKDSDLNGYVTETELEGKGYLTSVDMQGYVTDTELDQKGYLTSIPPQYVTDSELEAKGYLTDADLSQYATKQYVNNQLQNTQRKLVVLQIPQSIWTSSAGMISVAVSGISNLQGTGDVTPIAFFGDYQNALGDAYFQAVPMLDESAASYSPCVVFAFIDNGTLSIKLKNYTDIKNLYVLLARTDNFFEG